MAMRIALAADHAGYVLKDELAAWLREAGHEVADLGTNGPDSVDYPQFGARLADHGCGRQHRDQWRRGDHHWRHADGGGVRG